MKKETQDNSTGSMQKPEYFELLKKEILTSDEAEDLLDHILYFTPHNNKQVHAILDKLDDYMPENPISLTTEIDEEAEGRKEIFVPLKNYWRSGEAGENEEYEQYEFDDDTSVRIFNELRKEKKKFENYLVQLHIQEILDAPYQHQIADQYEDDVEEVLVPKNENWFFDADNAYMQHLLRKDFSVDIQNYSPSIRKNFFDFLNSRSVENILRLKKFTQQFGSDGLKSFLVLEIDGNIGESILKIGNNLNENIDKQKGAESVFQKISELVDLADRENEKLSALFKDGGEAIDVRGQLLEKTRKIIIDFSQVLEMSVIGDYNKKEKQEFLENLLSDLEESKTEVVLLASAMKAVKESGEKIDLEYVKNLDFSVKDFGQEFSQEEKEEMLSIAEINWRQNPNMKDMVVESFEKSLSDSKNQKFYVLKYQGKIVSFMRFEEINRGTLYAGSFNVYPDARSTGIGEEMMGRALKKESEDNTLEATVSPRIPAGTAYVERVGFVINGIIANYHETGEPLFNIELDNQKNLTYQYRNEGKEIQIGEEEIKKQVCNHEMLEHMIGNQEIVLFFDMKNDFEKMNQIMQKLLHTKDDNGNNVEDDNENKYIITRYFKDKNEKEKDLRYFVLEKMKN